MSSEWHVDPRWVERVADTLLERLTAWPTLRMCLATGTTPLPVYERVATAPGVFAAASVLLLDEFGGLPDDEPQRCNAVLRRVLVDHIAPADYRPIDADADDLDAECAAVDRWIDRGGLDLAVLGLGVNGHVGMNEPGASPSGRTARVDLTPSTIDGAQRYFAGRHRPTWGVTIGLGDLLRAREIWVLAASSTKTDIVARSLQGSAGADVPASLLQEHPNCTWWLDPPAAANLQV